MLNVPFYWLSVNEYEIILSQNLFALTKYSIRQTKQAWTFISKQYMLRLHIHAHKIH